MRAGRRGVLAMLVLAGVAFLGGCTLPRDIRDPDVVLEGVRPIGGGLFAQTVALDLRITNPNDFALPLDGLTMDLDVNGMPFARGVSDARVSIPRLASRTVSVEATVSTLDLARQVFAADLGSGFSYSTTGTLFLGDRFARRNVDFARSGALDLGRDGGRVLAPR